MSPCSFLACTVDSTSTTLHICTSENLTTHSDIDSRPALIGIIAIVAVSKLVSSVRMLPPSFILVHTRGISTFFSSSLALRGGSVSLLHHSCAARVLLVPFLCFTSASAHLRLLTRHSRGGLYSSGRAVETLRIAVKEAGL
jgi:hypothetical protein